MNAFALNSVERFNINERDGKESVEAVSAKAHGDKIDGCVITSRGFFLKTNYFEKELKYHKMLYTPKYELLIYNL